LAGEGAARVRAGLLVVVLVLASLGLAACGTAPGTAPRARLSPSPHLVVTPASPSPSAAPSATPTPLASSEVDLSFSGAVMGVMTALEGHSCSAAHGIVTVAFQGQVAGRSYFVTIDISDPGLGPGTWAISTPASQRQGGLENSTPQVGLSASSPAYEAAPGASGGVTLDGDPASTAFVEGTVAATLVPVGSNSQSGSLSVSGDFGCPTS